MRWPLGIKMMVGLLLLVAPVEAWAQGGAIDRYAAGSKRNPRAGRSASSARMERPARPEFMQELTTGLYWYQPTATSLGPGLVLQGFNYSPRYAFWSPNDLMSVSAGSNLGLALQWSNFGSLFMVNVPLLVELNLGRGSLADRDDAVGFFGGLGLEYNFINNFWLNREVDSFGNIIREYQSNLNQWGLMYSAGARVLLGGRPYVLRFSQSLGVPSQNVRVTHLGLGTSLY